VSSVAARLLNWYRDHGRRDLPWKQEHSLYRIWVSEIMLQQTQVSTVIPYFQRFMAQFPSVERLAGARLDEVLHLWSGLGYYARARNLHRAAQVVVESHDGHIPENLEDLVALPGIGRSTAGAVLALGLNQRHPILDGNVKRVLARCYALDGWPGSPQITTRLWHLAEENTPNQRVADYTQAIMDLGATVCVRRGPACRDCPLIETCQSHARGLTNRIPASRPRSKKPARETKMVIVVDGDGAVLLERRPPVGIWGGLWGFPECALDSATEQWCLTQLGLRVKRRRALEAINHGFTHFSLRIQPVLLKAENPAEAVMEGPDRVWYNPKMPDSRGIAAPVARLLAGLESEL